MYSARILIPILLVVILGVEEWVRPSLSLAENRKDESVGRELASVSPERREKILAMLARYPAPTRPGVDLGWHMDRTVEYMTRVIDRTRGGLPYYANHIGPWPARLEHAEWDAPHCVGRLLHGITLWEETFKRRVADEEAVSLLRKLLHATISPADHFAHFPAYCRESEEVDWHSQREVLLSLAGLYHRDRQDSESRRLAGELVRAYEVASRPADYPMNPMWHGRFIEAALWYHQKTGDELSKKLAVKLARDFYGFFDDKGTFPRPSHNHSITGTMAGVLRVGILEGEKEYVEKIKRIVDDGLRKVSSSFGLVYEGEGPRGEANCTADAIRIFLMLGLHGYPEYFDDAERMIRNHLLVSQHLDASFGGKADGRELPARTEKVDFADAATRVCGGFGFTEANDFLSPNYLAVALDLAEGAMNALVAVWNSIATVDADGIHVHLLFSRRFDDFSVRSYLPHDARVAVDVPPGKALRIRVPTHVDSDRLRLTLNGKSAPCKVESGYVGVPAGDAAVTVELTWKAEPRIVEETIGKVTYRIEWLGNTVWNMTPAGKVLPLYYPARLDLHRGGAPTERASTDPSDTLETLVSGLSHAARTEHVAVFSDISEEFSNQHAEHGERAWKCFAGLFGHTPGSRTEIYYTRDRGLYARILAFAPSTVIPGGRSVTSSWHGDHRKWYIVPLGRSDYGTQLHEISHDFLYASFRGSEAFPWFKEGSGMYFENGVWSEIGDLVVNRPLISYLNLFPKAARRDRLLPLDRLVRLGTDEFYRSDLEQVYAQSQMLFYYLMKKQADVMDGIFELLRAGGIRSNAQILVLLRDGTGLSIAELDRAYREYGAKL